MTSWDLAIADNWELILSESKVATQRTEPTFSRYFHNPITPIYCAPSSNLLLIGTRSISAKPHWYRGAIASQFLYVSPSLINYSISGVQASDTKQIGLNRLTIVEFKDYNVFPYVLELKIPFWLEDVTVEVWEYSTVIVPGNEDILDRLADIEQKIDSMEDYGA